MLNNVTRQEKMELLFWILVLIGIFYGIPWTALFYDHRTIFGIFDHFFQNPFSCMKYLTTGLLALDGLILLLGGSIWIGIFSISFSLVTGFIYGNFVYVTFFCSMENLLFKFVTMLFILTELLTVLRLLYHANMFSSLIRRKYSAYQALQKIRWGSLFRIFLLQAVLWCLFYLLLFIVL